MGEKNPFDNNQGDRPEQKEKPIELVAEVLHELDEKIFQELMVITKEAEADGLRGADDEEFWRKYFENEKNIVVVLKEGDRIVGFRTMSPHNDVLEEIGSDDPGMHEDEERYYGYFVDIIKDHRGRSGLRKLLMASFEEAQRRFGVTKFSTHARIENRLSENLKKILAGKITKIRFIPKWPHTNDEPYEYLEWTYGEFEK